MDMASDFDWMQSVDAGLPNESFHRDRPFRRIQLHDVNFADVR